MLDIAKRHRRSIALLLSDSDDGVLQDAAYLTQQLVEKLLKYTYECLGTRYPFGHNISDLLATLPVEQTVIPEELYVRLLDHADVLTLWESKTRYPANYIAVRKIVEGNVALADELLATVESYKHSVPKSASITVKQMRLF